MTTCQYIAHRQFCFSWRLQETIWIVTVDPSHIHDTPQTNGRAIYLEHVCYNLDIWCHCRVMFTDLRSCVGSKPCRSVLSPRLLWTSMCRAENYKYIRRCSHDIFRISSPIVLNPLSCKRWAPTADKTSMQPAENSASCPQHQRLLSVVSGQPEIPAFASTSCCCSVARAFCAVRVGSVCVLAQRFCCRYQCPESGSVAAVIAVVVVPYPLLLSVVTNMQTCTCEYSMKSVVANEVPVVPMTSG